MSARNQRFVNRVAFERRALSLINRTFAEAAPLVALTEPAIEKWCEFASTGYPCSHVQKTAKILREISKRLEIQADNSREAFESADTPSAEPLLVRLEFILH